jgi:histidinol-phosphatase (PHP family)
MKKKFAYLPPDYHMHTALCKHAEGQPIDYVRSAIQKGLREIAVTDHGPTPRGFDPEHRMDISQFGIYKDWIDMARLDGDCRVLFGIEADYFEGCKPFMSKWLTQYPFDIVLGSIHDIGSWNRNDPEARSMWESSDVNAVWRRYFELIGEMADTELYDVVTHLDLPKRGGNRPRDRNLPDLVLPALDRIARAGMAIEINTSGLRHPVNEMYPAPRILAWAREREIPIVFGSDAHLPVQVASDFGLAVVLAREVGYLHCVRFRRRRWKKIPLPD